MLEHACEDGATRRLRISYEKVPPNPPLTKGGIGIPLLCGRGKRGSSPFIKGGQGGFWTLGTPSVSTHIAATQTGRVPTWPLAMVWHDSRCKGGSQTRPYRNTLPATA